MLQLTRAVFRLLVRIIGLCLLSFIHSFIPFNIVIPPRSCLSANDNVLLRPCYLFFILSAAAAFALALVAVVILNFPFLP